MLRARTGHNNLFFRLFPPPKFLVLPAVGLDISDKIVRFASLNASRRGLELGAFGAESLAAGGIEEGFIKNKDTVVKALVALRKKYNLRYVNVSLPEEKAYLFSVELPAMDPKEIRGALSFKIEENVPVKLADAVFDYYYTTAPVVGEPVKLGVAVTHTKVVQSYMDVAIEAGLTPLSLQVESQAVARVAVCVSRLPESKAHIVVAVRDTKTVFAIVASNTIRFSSTLAIGGQAIGTSIEKSFSVDPIEAENIRKGKESRERDELFFSLINAASVIRDEVGRLLTYWESHGDPTSPKIADIALTGSDALLGLNDYLARSFDLPVRIANVWQNIQSLETVVPAMTYRESLDYAPALGLALAF